MKLIRGNRWPCNNITTVSPFHPLRPPLRPPPPLPYSLSPLLISPFVSFCYFSSTPDWLPVPFLSFVLFVLLFIVTSTSPSHLTVIFPLTLTHSPLFPLPFFTFSSFSSLFCPPPSPPPPPPIHCHFYFPFALLFVLIPLLIPHSSSSHFSSFHPL